jgi:acyl-CoA synthetase (AMP-forming)/AMP-acid ligase II
MAVDAIPKTSVGKFLKSAIREQYRDFYITSANRASAVPSPAATESAGRT